MSGRSFSVSLRSGCKIRRGLLFRQIPSHFLTESPMLLFLMLLIWGKYSGRLICPCFILMNIPCLYGKFLISGVILIIIPTCCFFITSKNCFLFVGWFWYLGTLVPVIGLIQISTFAMADRYTYLPSIGIAIMLAWGIRSLFKSEEIRKKILFPAGIAVLIILLFLTWQQCGYWKNALLFLAMLCR